MAFNYNGNEPKKILYNGNNVAKLNYNDTTVWKALPSEYERLLYIESTGTQYIDTGVGKRDAYGYAIEFKSTGIAKYMSVGYNLDMIFGCNGNDNYDTKLWFGYNLNNNTGRNSIQIRNQAFYFMDYIALETYYGNKHKVTIYNHEIYYDDNKIGTYNDKSFYSNTKLYIFASRSDTSNRAEFFSKTQLYYLKIYDKDNRLLRDFIPCYRKSDNKPRII